MYVPLLEIENGIMDLQRRYRNGKENGNENCKNQ